MEMKRKIFFIIFIFALVISTIPVFVSQSVAIENSKISTSELIQKTPMFLGIKLPKGKTPKTENPSAPSEVSGVETSKIPSGELAQKTSDILALLCDEPSGGKVITRQELDTLRSTYRPKISGNTVYTKGMQGDFIKKNGKWTLGKHVNIYEVWSPNQQLPSSVLNETLTVADAYSPADVGVTKMNLMKYEDKGGYMYTWIKATKTGKVFKIPKPENIQIQNESETVTLYEDQTISGQLCKVYSITRNLPQGDKQTTYYWFSTVKGIDIMTANYPNSKLVKLGKNAEQTTNFIYDSIGSNQDNSFFNQPTDVKFSE